MNFLLAFNLLTRVLSTNGLCDVLMNYANLYCFNSKTCSKLQRYSYFNDERKI